MHTKAAPLFVALLSFVSIPLYAQNASEALVGYWYTEDDDSIVKVTKDAGKYSGKIIWLAEPRYEKGDKNAGKLKFDRENREKKLRKRKIVGLPVLKNFVYDAKDKKWSEGTIYDPEVGKIYKCELKIEPKAGNKKGHRLYVRGYIGFPTLGRTTYWTPTPEADLKKYELLPEEKK